jgi:hypothetical protein
VRDALRSRPGASLEGKLMADDTIGEAGLVAQVKAKKPEPVEAA